MNKRLVWNFEIDASKPLVWENLPKEEAAELSWEARYFWPENSIIVLSGLSESILDLSQWKLKQKSDNYLLIPSQDINLKQRKQTLQYKPLLDTSEAYQGFGSKIDLSPDLDLSLPGTELSASTLLDLSQGKRLLVEKTAFIYKFNTEPQTKFELARLQIKNKIYFSACIEAKSLALVSAINQYLLKGQVSCDYVNFLRRIF